MLLASVRSLTKAMWTIAAKTPILLCCFFLFSCSSGVVPPVLLSSGDLDYPAEQRDAQIQGFVVVAYDVTEKGAVHNVRVVEADPPDVFNAVAIEYVKTWVFQPRKNKGIPEISKNMQSRIAFLLDEGDQSYLDFIK